MITVFIFLFFLLLENLLLPALIGPGPFLITEVFILGLVIYGRRWQTFAFQAVPLIIIEEIFTGIGIGKFLGPLAVTSLIYFWLNQFINFTEYLRDSTSNIMASAFILLTLGYLYSFLFVLFGNTHNIAASWNEWRIFFTASLWSMLGWSLAISALFKYVLKTK